MKRPTPPTRSLTEIPGWIKKICERCGGDFWSVPSQAKFTRFCAKDCRHDPPDVVLANSTTKGPNPDDCWICNLTPSSEYPYIKVHGENMRASRYALELALGRPIRDGLYALHSCDNTRCVRFDHLREGTTQDNADDRVKRNRSAKGEAHGWSDLKNEQVVEIKKLHGHQTLVVTAQQFGKSINCIWDIWHGNTWKHIVVDAPS